MLLSTRDQGREARDRIGESTGQAKKRKTPLKSCTHDVERGGDLGGDRKKCRQESVDSVTANPDNLENRKEAGREAQGAQCSRNNCTMRESVSSSSCLIRDFRNKYHWSHLGESTRV